MIWILPVVLLGVLTATDIISLREVTEAMGLRSLSGAVSDARLGMGTQMAHMAEFGLATVGGMVLLLGFSAATQLRRI